MNAKIYFVRPLAGTPHTRYYLLAGDHTVVRTQISRPDGIEVPEPAQVRFARRQFGIASTALPRRLYSSTISHLAADSDARAARASAHGAAKTSAHYRFRRAAKPDHD